MPSLNHQQIDDEISRASFELLIKEPFYAHVLAGMPRIVSEDVETIGLKWNGQQVVLQVNPEWFSNGLAATQRKIALKHEVLHIVFRHLFRPADRDTTPLSGWPTLEIFPEPAPTTRPRCKLLWVVAGGVVDELPFGANLKLEIN